MAMARIRCFHCREWYSEKGISRDGYSIFHKGFRLDSIIVSWVPTCQKCSTFQGKLKSILVRAFGRLFSLYSTRRIKSMIGR